MRKRRRKEPKREEKAFPEEKKKVEGIPPPGNGVTRKKERRGPSPFLAILFVLVLLILGLFYLWTEVGSGGKLSPYLNTPLQKIKGVWEKIWGTEKEGLEIGDLTGYEEKVGDLSLFVIEGKVSNQSRYAKSHIKVKVILFDQDKVKMAEKEAICGRVLSRQELKGQPPAFFKGDMIVKPHTDTEQGVPTSRVVPFMIIFRDPLNQAKEFKVEIIEAPNL